MVNDEKPTVDELRLQVDRLAAFWDELPGDDRLDRAVFKRLEQSEKELRVREAELLRFFTA